MNVLFIDIVFAVFSLIILGKTIMYGVYEIKTENNLFGGFCVILFSIISVLFCNIVIFVN